MSLEAGDKIIALPIPGGKSAVIRISTPEAGTKSISIPMVSERAVVPVSGLAVGMKILAVPGVNGRCIVIPVSGAAAGQDILLMGFRQYASPTDCHSNVYHSLDGGATWIFCKSLDEEGSMWWDFCYMGGGVVLCCYTSDDTAVKRVDRSTDNGLTWTNVASLPGGGYSMGLTRLSTNRAFWHIWIGGSTCVTYETTDNGLTFHEYIWSEHANSALLSAGGRGIFLRGFGADYSDSPYWWYYSRLSSVYNLARGAVIRTSDTSALVNGDREVFYSLDNGVNWSLSDLNSYLSPQTPQKAVSCGSGIIVSFKVTYDGSYHYYLVRSTDYGAHFINVLEFPSGESPYALCYLGGGIVLCTTGGSPCKLYRSLNYGETWSEFITLGTAGYFATIYKYNTSDITEFVT